MSEGKFLADTFCHGDPKLVAEQTMANADFGGPPNLDPCTKATPATIAVAYQPPVMYEATTDSYRAVTQADWDRAERSLQLLHEFLNAVRKAESVLPARGKAWP